MAWTKRVCRFWHVHHIFRQEADQSCGPSCAAMLFQRLRGAKIGAGLSYSALDDYGRGGQQAAYDGVLSTMCGELAQMVRNVLGRGAVGRPGILGGPVVNAIIEKNVAAGRPVIARVDWIPSHGGHFVLIDRMTTVFGKKYICVCDPWDQHVHPIRIQTSIMTSYRPMYDGAQQSGIMDGDVVELI